MQTESYIRKFDHHGRISIPAQFRKELRLGINDETIIEIMHNSITISPYKNNKCVFCGTETNRTFNEKHVCNNCVVELSKLE